MGRPEDWRVETLDVERGRDHLPPGTIHIRLSENDRIRAKLCSSPKIRRALRFLLGAAMQIPLVGRVEGARCEPVQMRLQPLNRYLAGMKWAA